MLKSKNTTIAIVDSGIGGVSVLKELIKKHKFGNYIYFADNLNMPYGNKSKKWLTNRIDYIVNLLKEKYSADIIILACNTASTCYENTCENLVKMRFDSKYVYYATNLTKKNLETINVISDRTLAKQIEKHVFNTEIIYKIIKRHVHKHKLNELKEFVLGCTHYELCKPIFEHYCPNTNVINNSSFIINFVNFKNENNEKNIVILLSKKDFQLENKILRLLKL